MSALTETWDLVREAMPFVGTLAAVWFGYRVSSLNSEHEWKRDRRAELYIDVLAEASAEKDWFRYRTAQLIEEMSPGEPREVPMVDDRMSSVERRRMGARIGAFASDEMVSRWSAFNSSAPWITSLLEPDLHLMLSKMAAAQLLMDDAFDALERQIRLELKSLRGEIRWPWVRRLPGFRPVTAEASLVERSRRAQQSSQDTHGPRDTG